MSVFEVCSPVGGNLVESKKAAPRLPSLQGATVGELWNGVFKGDLTFPIIRKALKQRFPDIKIIPYTEFPFLHGGDNPSAQLELAKRLAALAKDKGCDAVISGNGA